MTTKTTSHSNGHPVSNGPVSNGPVPKDAILEDVVGMLLEVIGEDFLLDVKVSPDTTFNEDLAVESIEFVALAEQLRARYGEKVDFVAFVGGMEIDEIMAMTVGQLVDHIHGCLSSRDGAGHG